MKERTTAEQRRSQQAAVSHEEIVARAERVLGVIPDDPYAGVVLFVAERLLSARSAARYRREQAAAADKPSERARSRRFRRAMGAR